MKGSIPVILVGIVAGIGGALVASHFNRPAPASAAAGEPAPERAPRPMVIPPGWDLALVARVAQLEQAVNQQKAETKRADGERDAGGTAAAAAADPVAQHERERREHYEKELAFRSDFIDKHKQEPVDSAWSQATSQTIREPLVAAESGDGAKVKDVDCRSKTCTATLTFSNPSDALAYIQQGGKTSSRAAIKTCNGSIMIPTPPTSDGAYDLTVLYTCR